MCELSHDDDISTPLGKSSGLLENVGPMSGAPLRYLRRWNCLSQSPLLGVWDFESSQMTSFLMSCRIDSSWISSPLVFLNCAATGAEVGVMSVNGLKKSLVDGDRAGGTRSIPFLCSILCMYLPQLNEMELSGLTVTVCPHMPCEGLWKFVGPYRLVHML